MRVFIGVGFKGLIFLYQIDENNKILGDDEIKISETQGSYGSRLENPIAYHAL